MSADNYFLIRKDGDKYAVEMRFASCEYAEDAPISPNAPRFDTLEEADECAHGEYAEYGVSYDFPVKTVEVEGPKLPSSFLVDEAINSIALSHPDDHDCDVCKAAQGDKAAWKRVAILVLESGEKHVP